MSGGDITKRDEILWGFTFDECKPYLKYKARDLVFREALLAILGVKDEKGCDDRQKEKCRFEFGKHLDWACKNCKKVN